MWARRRGGAGWARVGRLLLCWTAGRVVERQRRLDRWEKFCASRRRGGNGRRRPRASMEYQMNTIRSLRWIGVITLGGFTGFTACNYTVGECYPRGEADGAADVGVGV